MEFPSGAGIFLGMGVRQGYFDHNGVGEMASIENPGAAAACGAAPHLSVDVTPQEERTSSIYEEKDAGMEEAKGEG